MPRVMVFGTFEMLHPGHLYFLQQARAHGDELIVVIARDATVAKVKQHATAEDELQRAENVKQTGLADQVVLGDLTDHYRVIRELGPDIICLGYDQEAFTKNLAKEFPAITIVRIKAHKPDQYKSSILRNAK